MYKYIEACAVAFQCRENIHADANTSSCEGTVRGMEITATIMATSAIAKIFTPSDRELVLTD